MPNKDKNVSSCPASSRHTLLTHSNEADIQSIKINLPKVRPVFPPTFRGKKPNTIMHMSELYWDEHSLIYGNYLTGYTYTPISISGRPDRDRAAVCEEWKSSAVW